MASGNSYRGQCNLHLFFAKQYLALTEEAGADSWSGHFERAQCESARFQLQLAYQSHLADIVGQQPRFALSIPAGYFTASDFAGDDVPPELDELVEREQQVGWLRDILDQQFLQPPGSTVVSTVQPQSGFIASDLGGPATLLRMSHLQFLLDELTSLINRHRAGLQEY